MEIGFNPAIGAYVGLLNANNVIKLFEFETVAKAVQTFCHFYQMSEVATCPQRMAGVQRPEEDHRRLQCDLSAAGTYGEQVDAATALGPY